MRTTTFQYYLQRSPKRTFVSLIVGLFFVVLLLTKASSVSATEIHDRRPFIDSNTETSDDPPRLPRTPARAPGIETVVKGGRVLDVKNELVRSATVVVRGNVITAILNPDSSAWSEDARVIDVTGKTVMPGLIDMHTHVTYPDQNTKPPYKDTPIDQQASEGSGTLLGQRNLRYFLESGFTSVRDLNGVSNAPYLLSEWSAENAIPAPRVFTGGHIITGTGGHATERPIAPHHGPEFAWEADGADEWRAAVRRNFKQGGSVVKIASHFSADEVEAAVDEAHLLGLRVTCDCETIYIDMAVEAGVDMIEHPLPRSDAAIKTMGKKGIGAIPTLQVYMGLLERNGGYYGSTSRRFTLTRDGMLDVFDKMKSAGVVMGVGSDTIGTASRTVPDGFIAELRWFVNGGFSNMQALKAATLTNAALLDMGDKLGSLEAGMLADIIIVDGQPDKNLSDLEKIDIVMKDGNILIDSGSLVTPRHDST